MKVKRSFIPWLLFLLLSACTAPGSTPATPTATYTSAAPVETSTLTPSPMPPTPTFDPGMPELPDVPELQPGTPWPVSPATFLVTYTDSLDDTYSCTDQNTLVQALAADMETIRILDNGSSLMTLEIELRDYDDAEYRLQVNMIPYASYKSTVLTAFISPAGATLSVDRKGNGVPLSPDDKIWMARTIDGKRKIRIVFMSPVDSYSELFMDVVQLVQGGENICDQFQRYLP